MILLLIISKYIVLAPNLWEAEGPVRILLPTRLAVERYLFQAR